MRSLRISLLSSLAFVLALANGVTAQEDVPTEEAANALVQAGQFEEAISLWKQRTLADPSDGRAHFMHAYCLHAVGDLERAHEAHITAARFAEFTATALYNHACVHALRNEKEDAFVALREAIAAGFDNVEQLETDTDMDNLRRDGRFSAILLELEGMSRTNLEKLPGARRFDFYLGDWTRRNGDRVERRLDVDSAFDGTGLLVASRNAEGTETTDTSLFVFDKERELWRQVWISSEGMTVVLEGGLVNGSMVMRQISQDGKPKKDARAVYTNVSDQGFTYKWQSTSDGGRTWETMATRIFTREV